MSGTKTHIGKPWIGASRPHRTGRATHSGRSEAARVGLRPRKLPQGVADRLHEDKVLSTPGLTEGIEHTNKVIEDWESSL